MIAKTNIESAKFISSLKAAGVVITNECEVIERLQEVRQWQFAFSTLVNHGNKIGISFSADSQLRREALKRIFADFKLSSRVEEAFEAHLMH